MKFRQYLEETTEKHAVLAFGRMNPPTTGHAKLVDKVKEVSKSVKGTHHVVLSHSHDSEKNPLTGEQKLKHAKRFFPDTNITISSKEQPNFLAQASKIYKTGATHLHMIAGSDRTGEYDKILHKYNGVKGTHGYFKFRGIEVHSAGERDPDAEGVSGMSASKMRAAAAKGNFKEFKKGIPSNVSLEHSKELYNDVRKGMQVKEDFQSQIQMILSEGVHDKGIFKAVFLSGGPGSGKDYVLDNTLAGHGLIEINSDKALEFLMDKNNLDKKMPETEADARTLVRGKAKDMTELKQKLALLGRNGIIINGTGDDPAKYAKIKKNLEEIGYETSMVAVVTRDEVSAQRNVERGQRGGRAVPEDIRKQKWDAVNNSRPDMAKLFGNSYVEFENSEDLLKAPPEVVKAKKEEMLNIFKTVQKFVQAPPKNEQAKAWVAGELQKKDTLPIPKKGTEQSLPHSAEGENKATDEARRLGLQYYGYGRYGKNGKVTHHSVHGSLVQDPTHAEQQKMIKKTAEVPMSGASSQKPVPKKPVKESINEDFQNLFEAVSVTFKADTPEELQKTMQMMTGNGDVESEEQEVEEHVDHTEMSDSGAYNLLTLGKSMFVSESISGERTVVKDGATYIASGNKPKVYAIRNNAAKDAHTKGGEVVKTDKGYIVKLKENVNVEISEKFLCEEQTANVTGATAIAESGSTSRGTRTSTSAEAIAESGSASGSSAGARAEGGSTSRGTGTSTSASAEASTKNIHEASRYKGKLTLSQAKNAFKEAIDKGIETGMSMAAGGEGIGRDMGEINDKNGKVNPLKKKPVAEMGGDSTTASIGAQKQDELSKQGISLSTFRGKNYL
jgi:hypothetical protein